MSMNYHKIMRGLGGEHKIMRGLGDHHKIKRGLGACGPSAGRTSWSWTGQPLLVQADHDSHAVQVGPVLADKVQTCASPQGASSCRPRLAPCTAEQATHWMCSMLQSELCSKCALREKTILESTPFTTACTMGLACCLCVGILHSTKLDSLSQFRNLL